MLSITVQKNTHMSIQNYAQHKANNKIDAAISIAQCSNENTDYYFVGAANWNSILFWQLKCLIATVAWNMTKRRILACDLYSWIFSDCIEKNNFTASGKFPREYCTRMRLNGFSRLFLKRTVIITGNWNGEVLLILWSCQFSKQNIFKDQYKSYNTNVCFARNLVQF